MPADTNTWPTLKSYDRNHLARIAMPLGGIGTGTISLGGRGDLRDWEIMNRPAKGNRGFEAFFVLRATTADGAPVMRLLEGPLELSEYEDAVGSTAQNHGLPRFRDCTFHAAYPLGQVRLSDADVPVSVRLRGFNPLIPCELDDSGIPIVALTYEVENLTDVPMEITIAGSVNNLMSDIAEGATHTNEFRNNAGVRGIVLGANNVPDNHEKRGTFALVTDSTGSVSSRTAWLDATWGNSLLDFWEDVEEDGRLDERPNATGRWAQHASLAVSHTIAPRETTEIRFVLCWHFPNRQTWTPTESCCESNRVGNYYTTQWVDAWDVARTTLPRLDELEERTIAFVRAFCDSSLPAEVKESALFNLSTLRTQTCFRTEDGQFYGFEGCSNEGGCCVGSCTHVWNYEQATAFLFGDITRMMREIEFLHATNERGLMSFRVHLPLERAQEFGRAAADGQMGCIMKAYRDWQLSGDDEFLRRLWPHVRRSLEFCWIPGGWDADRDGIMEGCQHNTMDVEYFGPNPEMGTWYLGALRAAEEMARYVGEVSFADECHSLFERGSAWMDQHLFNGEYYEHEIRPITDPDAIAEGLTVGMGASDLSDPALQLGSGCLIDQLVGQYMAHICGLGYLLKPENVRTTLESILKYNSLDSFHAHFNTLRSYALGEESALLMASYPLGRRPAQPFPYYTEAWSGLEYTAAAGMMQEGMIEEGLQCIRNVRERYDGRKRSPFDEAECGHHYARAMASWAAVPAMTGFLWSGVTRTMSFAAVHGTHFWSNGWAWGTCEIRKSKRETSAVLIVIGGEITIERFTLTGIGVHEFAQPEHVTSNGKVRISITS
jgi:non-lysosomal glucosylceramidase